MRVAVFGSTGQLGRHVLRFLLDRGHRPRVLVRDVLKLSEDLVQEDIVEGNVHDHRDVMRTLDGAQAVISTLGMADITQPATDLSEGIGQIVASMGPGLSRIIAVGGAGILAHPDGGLRRDHALPEYLRHVTAEHERVWHLLEASNKEWTLVCPVFFTDDLINTRYRVAREALPEGSDFVMLHDVAEFIVDELEKGEFIRAKVGIVSDLQS